MWRTPGRLSRGATFAVRASKVADILAVCLNEYILCTVSVHVLYILWSKLGRRIGPDAVGCGRPQTASCTAPGSRCVHHQHSREPMHGHE